MVRPRGSSVGRSVGADTNSCSWGSSGGGSVGFSSSEASQASTKLKAAVLVGQISSMIAGVWRSGVRRYVGRGDAIAGLGLYLGSEPLKVTLGSCWFLVFLFVEFPLVGSKVINLFSNKGFNVGSNLEAVATELLSRLCVINYGLCFCVAAMVFYHSSFPRGNLRITTGS